MVPFVAVPRYAESYHPWSFAYLKLRLTAWFLRVVTGFFGQTKEIKRQYGSLPDGVTRTRVLIPAREGGGRIRMIKADRYEKVGTTEEQRKNKGVHLNFHGSGYIIPSLGMDAIFCSRLALKVSATHTVYDVDYRKAPEAPFPCALNDGLDAAAYFVSPERSNSSLSLSGFSSGGNLAMGLATSLPPGVCKNLVAFYPNADTSTTYVAPTPREDATSGIVSNNASLRVFFKKCFILPHELREDPRLSPLFADVEKWPKHVWITIGDADATFEGNRKLVKKLKEGGADAVFVNFEKGGHAFDRNIKGSHAEKTQARVEKIYEAAFERVVLYG